MKLHHFLYFILIIFCGKNLFAQQYNFITYSVNQGLAQSQVTDVCQDSLGYLWIGTQSGLNKFDGKEFTSYSVDDGLSDNTINKLFYSKKNVLYIATLKGISVYESQKFKSYFFETPLRVNDIKIFNDKLYLATNIGLYLMSEKGEFQSISDSINETLKIRSISNYNDSILFCATQDGLYLFKNNQLTKSDNQILFSSNLSDIQRVGDVFYLSSYTNGVIKYDYLQKTAIEFSIKHKNIRGVFAGANEIWAVSNVGLIQIDGIDTTYYNEFNGLPINNIKRVFKDVEGNVWVGTYGKGLLKFTGKSVLTYTLKDGFPSDIIMGIGEGFNNQFTFGTYDKGVIILLKDKEIINITEDDGLPHNTVWTVFNDSKGITWLGTTNGVACIENNKLIKYKEVSQIKSKIRNIHGYKNTILFGGKDELWEFKNNEFKRILYGDKYDINKIQTNESHIFLATKNGVFYNDIDNYYTDFDSILFPENNVNSITIDVYNNLWVGTVNGLFIHTKNGFIIPFNLEEENFKSKNILGLLTDKNGNIWVSTTNGVYMIEKDESSIKGYKINHYSNQEGVTDLESNLNAIFEDEKGMIWVGTSAGLLKINPSLNRQLFDYDLPNLSINSIRLFKEDFDYSFFNPELNDLTGVPEKIKLPYSKNHLTFDFIGVNFKNQNNVRYTYRLLGAEDNWSPPSSENSATYSFISPGEYVFQVKSTIDGLNWSDTKEINIIITPPYWKTWWFISFIVLVTILISYFIIRGRIKSIEQKKDNEQLVYKNRLRELEQQSLNASMNRHFIFNSLNSIQYYINNSDRISANKYLSSFAKLIRKNLDSSTSKNFIVSLDEEIERIELYLSLEKMRFNEQFEYKINVDENIDLETTYVPSMILQPFVENSIIHGVLPKNDVKGKIELNIRLELDTIIFEVIDDGVGYDESIRQKVSFSGDHQSKGMEITNNRIDLLRKINGDKLLIIGPFQINDENSKSKGTKVIIKLPLMND